MSKPGFYNNKMTLEKLLFVEELHPKTIRGDVTFVLKAGGIIKFDDDQGFELFKILRVGNKAQLFLNGKKVLS